MPTAVAANQPAPTNEEVLAAIGKLAERITAMEQLQQQLLVLLLPPVA